MVESSAAVVAVVGSAGAVVEATAGVGNDMAVASTVSMADDAVVAMLTAAASSLCLGAPTRIVI